MFDTHLHSSRASVGECNDGCVDIYVYIRAYNKDNINYNYQLCIFIFYTIYTYYMIQLFKYLLCEIIYVCIWNAPYQPLL